MLAHKWKSPQAHFPNSRTASSRTVVLTLATFSIFTNYGPKWKNNKYIKTYILGKKLKTIKLKLMCIR